MASAYIPPPPSYNTSKLRQIAPDFIRSNSISRQPSYGSIPVHGSSGSHQQTQHVSHFGNGYPVEPRSKFSLTSSSIDASDYPSMSAMLRTPSQNTRASRSPSQKSLALPSPSATGSVPGSPYSLQNVTLTSEGFQGWSGFRSDEEKLRVMNASAFG